MPVNKIKLKLDNQNPHLIFYANFAENPFAYLYVSVNNGYTTWVDPFKPFVPPSNNHFFVGIHRLAI